MPQHRVPTYPPPPSTTNVSATATAIAAATEPQHEYSPPAALLTPHSQAQQTLRLHQKLLHLLHHRNKNQHHRSLWYRHFNTLRREVKKLCIDLGMELGSGFKTTQNSDSKPYDKKFETARDTNLKRKRSGGVGKLNLNTRERNEGVRRACTSRLREWIERGLVQRCYVAFTSLLHTPSSAALALVLLAILARVAGVTGITAYLGSVATKERRMELEGKSVVDGLSKFESVDAQRVVDLELIGDSKAEAEDKGVAVEMEVEVDAVPGQDGAMDTAVEKDHKAEGEATYAQDKRKKRRKRGNAIDEIFAGLA